MESKPLVSLNILTYNRKDLLKITLLKIKEQDYINIEIIVVDNASTDGTGEMIEKEFPDVIHIKMEKNYGISGWNRGFKRAAGEYIMVLDDDSYPTNGVIENGLREFSNNRDLGAVTFNVFNRAANSSETSEFMIHPYFFHGCGTLFRKSVLDEIGYFNELIFIYYHELDFSSRIYDAGYKILYLSGFSIIHNRSMPAGALREKENNHFKSEFMYTHYFISYATILLQRFSWNYILVYLTKWIINRAIICVANNYYGSFVKSLIFLIRNIPRIMMGRSALSKEVQKFYRYGNEVLIDRNYFPDYKKNYRL